MPFSFLFARYTCMLIFRSRAQTQQHHFEGATQQHRGQDNTRSQHHNTRKPPLSSPSLPLYLCFSSLSSTHTHIHTRVHSPCHGKRGRKRGDQHGTLTIAKTIIPFPPQQPPRDCTPAALLSYLFLFFFAIAWAEARGGAGVRVRVVGNASHLPCATRQPRQTTSASQFHTFPPTSLTPSPVSSWCLYLYLSPFSFPSVSSSSSFAFLSLLFTFAFPPAWFLLLLRLRVLHLLPQLQKMCNSLSRRQSINRCDYFLSARRTVSFTRRV